MKSFINSSSKARCFSLLVLSIMISLGLFAQIDNDKRTQHFMLAGTYGYGPVLPTSPFVEGDNLKGSPIDRYQFASVKALWQNPGYTQWQRVYRGPYYGFGFSLGDFFNPKEIGYPISSYSVLGVPVMRWNRLEAFTEFQFGMTGNWKHYDSISNPKNIVIGGGLTVHLDIALRLFYQLGPHFDAGAGVSFVHFSNGGFERPNRGFNLYAPSLELRYRFADRPAYKQIEKADKEPLYHNLLIMLAYGDYQLVEHELDSNYFAFGGLSLIYFNQLTNAFRLGAGSDFNYWWGLNANADGTSGGYSFENITIGLIVQPEFMINKLTLVGGVGVYARHRNFGNFEQLYQRLGVRFELYKNLSMGINVRAVNFMLAEVLEFNWSYRFDWEKKP